MIYVTLIEWSILVFIGILLFQLRRGLRERKDQIRSRIEVAAAVHGVRSHSFAYLLAGLRKASLENQTAQEEVNRLIAEWDRRRHDDRVAWTVVTTVVGLTLLSMFLHAG